MKTLIKLENSKRGYSQVLSGLSATVCALSLLLCADLSAQVTGNRDPLYLYSRNDRNENDRQDPAHLIGNIWWVGHTKIGSFLITTPEGLILIDPTHPETVNWVVENIVKAGFHLEDIKYILNSHTDNDQVGGMAALQRLLPHAKIITTKETADVLATGGRSHYRNHFRELAGVEGTYYEPVKVDGYIGHLETLTLGGVTLTAHHTPGHTIGTTTWSMKVYDKGKEYNAVFLDNMAVLGADGPLLNNEFYPDIRKDFENSFAYLKKLPCDVYLHAKADAIKLSERQELLAKGGNMVNPFVDPEGCQDHIFFFEERFKKQLREEMTDAGM